MVNSNLGDELVVDKILSAVAGFEKQRPFKEFSDLGEGD